jgi:copper chaperone CopZ
MGTVTLVAPDITCGKCKENIETDLSQVAGVRTGEGRRPVQGGAVEYDDAVLTPDVLRRTMVDIGYPAAD